MSENTEKRMTFTQHLGELRTRIIRVGITFLIGVIICYAFHDAIFDIVSYPLSSIHLMETTDNEGEGKEAQNQLLSDKMMPLLIPLRLYPNPSIVIILPPPPAQGLSPSSKRWVSMTPFEPIVVALKLSVLGGFLFALPVILFQICAFVFPGLTQKEKKLVRMLVAGSSVLSLAGVSVAYFAVFPLILPFLIQWAPESVDTYFRMNETISIILKGLVGFAIAFQFPMIIFSLVYMDLLEPVTLKHFRRQAIVCAAVVGMLLTPADVVSMVMLAIPLVILYELSIWASYLIAKKKNKPEQADTD